LAGRVVRCGDVAEMLCFELALESEHFGRRQVGCIVSWRGYGDGGGGDGTVHEMEMRISIVFVDGIVECMYQCTYASSEPPTSTPAK
jgi:hypothetical protein